MQIVHVTKGKPHFAPDVRIDHATLDMLLPLHLLVGLDGRVLHAGPTLAKILAGVSFAGLPVFDLMSFKRPAGLIGFKGLLAQSGATIRAGFRPDLVDGDIANFKGITLSLPHGQGVLLNLSLGSSARDLVARFDLKARDFSAADTTMDMLYMIEVQSALLSESKGLNNRLQGAKLLAEEQAYSDALTGLNNLRALRAFLQRLQARGTGAGFAIMHLDLDFFKSVNDTYGHAAGDHVLLEVARVLLSETRTTDLVARVGGDEFVLVFADCTDRATLGAIAERIIAGLQKPIAFGASLCRIGGSIGLNLSTNYRVPDTENLLRGADAALYASKAGGRGQYTFYSATTPLNPKLTT
jgi:diguanylate cyclase (GGDEF)-like protein